MKPLRLALTSGNYHHIKDGVSLTLNRLVDFLETRQVDVRVFAPVVKKPDLKHNGVLHPVFSLPAPGRSEYRIPLLLGNENRARLEAFHPDLVHIATPDPVGFQTQKWAMQKGIPVVSSFHTNFISYLPYYRLSWLMNGGYRLMNRFYNRCEHVYVPTPSMADELIRWGIEAHRIKLWQRGVDAELFHPSKRSMEWRASHGIQSDELVVAFVSRLVLEKNTDLFCQVVRSLDPSLKVRALVVGDGPARSRMQEFLPEGIFTGRLLGEDLATAYASSDLFFFPSVTETFGNVTLEAMASGLPCVVADAAGSSSLVERGNSGEIVPVHEPQPAIQVLENLLEDTSLRLRMGVRSREIASGFSFTKINEQLLDYYTELKEDFDSAPSKANSSIKADSGSIVQR